MSRYVVSNMSDISNIVIPFFDKYSLLTTKSLDYKDWKKLIELKLSKTHLDIYGEGIEKMKQIKAGMNSNRTYYPLFNCCQFSHLNSLLLSLSINPSLAINSCPMIKDQE